MIKPDRIVISADYEYPEAIEETIERFNARTTEENLSSVDRLEHENGTVMLAAYPRTSEGYEGAYEEAGHLIVNDSPFGNGDFLWQRLRTQFLADATGAPVASITAPGTDGSKYEFGSNKKALAEGNFDPYTSLGQHALKDVAPFVENVVLLGPSQGAVVAMNRAQMSRGIYEVKGVGVYDPTTAEARGRAKLFKALTSAGYDRLHAELELGGVESLLEVFGYGEENKKNDLQRMAHYFRSIRSNLGTNYAIAKGLGRPTLAEITVDLIESEIPVTIGFGANSAIATTQSLAAALEAMQEKLADNGTESAMEYLEFLEFEGTDHAGSDNMRKLGLVALRATR